jgi:hypothetical protein
LTKQNTNEGKQGKMDRSDCNRIFGAENVTRVESFKINGGSVDFGDIAHLGGAPQGDAVICWLKNGRVAVMGKLFSDNFWNPQTATIEVRFRRSNGQVTNPTTRSFSTQGGIATWRDIDLRSPIGNFTEVRIRLKCFLPNTGLGSVSSVLADETFERRETIRLHIKILTNPSVGITTMVDSMRQVYASAEINVRVISTENLNLPALNDIDVGACVRGSTTTEQIQLFANRHSVRGNDVVAYFVRTVTGSGSLGPLNGCAAHPDGRPGAVIAQGGTQWTLGHEIGHVLGLNHVNNNKRLMTGNGTSNIIDPPPDLSTSEVQTMLGSNLTITT